MSLESDYLAALQAKVQEILQIEIREGFFNGPSPNEDIGCIYISGGREDENVVRERFECRVRIFLRMDKQPEPLVPISMTPLREIVEKVQVDLSAQAQGGPTLGGVWMHRLTEWEYNPNQYGVEMQFMAVSWNLWEVVHPTT